MGAHLRRLPKHIYAPAGPVPVRRKRNLTDPDTGKPLFGLWVPAERVIYIEQDVSLPTAHQTLRHEQFHAWVDDLGIQLGNAVLERLCEMYAVGRMGEFWEDQR